MLGVGTVGEEEVDELSNVVRDDGHLEHADLLEHIEDLSDTVLVALLETLVEDTDHLGHGGLHGSEIGRGIALEILGDLAEGADGGDADLDALGILEALGKELHDLGEMLVERLAAVDEGLEDGVEDEERDLAVGSVGRVGGLEEERQESGPRAGGELALGDLGDDTGDRVSDGSGLLVGDNLEQLGLDTVTHLHRLLGPDLASALGQTLSELDGSELSYGQIGRGGEDLEEGGNTLRVLVVVVLELLGGGLDGVSVRDVALLEELVEPLDEGGL